MKPPPSTRLPVCGVVDHAGLAGRDADLGLGEADGDAVGRALDLGGTQRLRRAHPHLHRQRAVEVRAEPVDVVERDLAAAERPPRADDDAARLGLELHDIERIVVRALALADRQAAALADGEAHDAVVAADDAAGHVDDLARIVRLGPQLLHDAA